MKQNTAIHQSVGDAQVISNPLVADVGSPLSRVTHRHDRSIRRGRYYTDVGYVDDARLGFNSAHLDPPDSPAAISESMRGYSRALVVYGELKAEELA